jgi:hypothetical protein
MNTNKRKYSVTVIPDEEREPFSPSSCNCKECTMMHIAQIEWDTFKPETILQRRMMTVIAKIERDIKAEKKSQLRTISKKLGYRKHNKRHKS